MVTLPADANANCYEVSLRQWLIPAEAAALLTVCEASPELSAKPQRLTVELLAAQLSQDVTPLVPADSGHPLYIYGPRSRTASFALSAPPLRLTVELRTLYYSDDRAAAIVCAADGLLACALSPSVMLDRPAMWPVDWAAALAEMPPTLQQWCEALRNPAAAPFLWPRPALTAIPRRRTVFFSDEEHCHGSC